MSQSDSRPLEDIILNREESENLDEVLNNPPKPLSQSFLETLAAAQGFFK